MNKTAKKIYDSVLARLAIEVPLFAESVLNKALKLGAKEISSEKAKSMLDCYINNYSKNDEIKWLTCSKNMGEDILKKLFIKDIQIIYKLKKGELFKFF